MSATVQFENDSSTAMDTRPLKIGILVLLVLIACLVAAFEDVRLTWLSSLCLAATAVGFVTVNTGTTFDLLHPARVFGSLWCFCLSLATMRLLPMISEWNFLMWSCVFSGLISFIAGFSLATPLWGKNNPSPDPENPDAPFHSVFLPDRKALRVAAVCIVLGAGVLAYEFHLIGGIPLFADNIDQMRMELFGTAGTGNPAFDTLFVKSIHFLVEFLKYGVFLAFAVLVQRRKKSRTVFLVCLFLVLFGTLAYISQAGRMFLIEIVTTSAVLFHYLRRRIRVVELGAAVLVLFVLLGVAGALRTQSGVTNSVIDRVRTGSGLPEGQFWEGIGFGYLTLTESFEVFYRLTTDLQTTARPKDGFLFYSVHRIIPRANIQEYALNLYSGLFVTPTYMGEFYADFGVPGIVFGSLALGLLYGWVYLQRGVPSPLFWVFVRGMFVQIVFFFPYVNLFSQYLNWIVDPIFLYLLIRYIRPQISPRLELAGTAEIQSEAM